MFLTKISAFFVVGIILLVETTSTAAISSTNTTNCYKYMVPKAPKNDTEPKYQLGSQQMFNIAQWKSRYRNQTSAP